MSLGRGLASEQLLEQLLVQLLVVLVLGLEKRFPPFRAHPFDVLGVELEEPLLHFQPILFVLVVVRFVDEPQLEQLVAPLNLALRQLEFLQGRKSQR
jgi:hypothetical protein